MDKRLVHFCRYVLQICTSPPLKAPCLSEKRLFAIVCVRPGLFLSLILHVPLFSTASSLYHYQLHLRLPRPHHLFPALHPHPAHCPPPLSATRPDWQRFLQRHYSPRVSILLTEFLKSQRYSHLRSIVILI